MHDVDGENLAPVDVAKDSMIMIYRRVHSLTVLEGSCMKYVVILRIFPHESALFGLVYI